MPAPDDTNSLDVHALHGDGRDARRRTLLATLLPAMLAIAAWIPGGTFAAAPVEGDGPAARRPNIVFIMSDDHCRQAISCYGASAAPGMISTPGIDRLAREGVRFDRASVTNAICGPSRAVILTGKHSHANGFATNDQRFDGAQQTFPKLLRAVGYRTEIVGKWHLASAPTGFDHSDILVGQGDYWNPTFMVDGVRTKREGHATDLVHGLAVERLRALAAEDAPFLLMVHHKAPHRNWLPALRHYALFRDGRIPEPDTLFDDFAGRSYASAMQTMSIAHDLAWEYDLKVPATRIYPEGKVPQLDRWMANELARIPADIRERIEAAYREENEALLAEFGSWDARALTGWKFQRYAKDYLRTAQGVDDSVGGLLDELDRLGIAGDTIVVYTSDQGWFLGEHGWYDKRWMYEESFRTPLLVRWPGRAPAGATCDALVQNLDFAPTFLEAAGVEVPTDMQGRSMAALLAEPAGPLAAGFHDAVYFRFEESRGAHTVPRHEGVATVRHKLLRFVDLVDPDTGAAVVELYDLEADPDERRDLSKDPAMAELLSGMTARLDSVRERFGVPADGPPTTRPPAASRGSGAAGSPG
jgi:arylsulfatase A-like enzyme